MSDNVSPSITRQVKRPVAKAPVSILIRFDRSSISVVGVCPWMIIFPKSRLDERNSCLIHNRSFSVSCARSTSGFTPAWTKKKSPLANASRKFRKSENATAVVRCETPVAFRPLACDWQISLPRHHKMTMFPCRQDAAIDRSWCGRLNN